MLPPTLDAQKRHVEGGAPGEKHEEQPQRPHSEWSVERHPAVHAPKLEQRQLWGTRLKKRTANARSLSGIAVSGERFDLVRELSDSLSSGFFRLSWQVV